MLAWEDGLGGAVKNAVLLVLLVMASSQLSAYGLTVAVTIADGTLAVGTNVSLERGGVQVANAIADASGTANFNVTAGSYFVQLSRYSFPAFVSLVDVEKDTSVAYTIWQGMTYSNSYGQIFGPSDFSNSSVTVYSGNQTVKRVTHSKNGYPDNNGYFLIQFLPEGNYRLVFDVHGYQEAEEDVFLPNAQFVEANPNLVPAVQQAPPQPVLSAPASVQQYSVIVASLSEGGGPMAGQNVSVQTPAGALSLTTASDGTVSVNAAEPGQYAFSYGNLTASTSVQGNQAQAPPQQPSQPEQQPSQNSSSQQSAQQPPGQASSILPFLAVGGLALLVIIAAAALFFIVSRYGKGKGEAGGHGAHPSEAHGHFHEGHEHHHASHQHHEAHGQKGKPEG